MSNPQEAPALPPGVDLDLQEAMTPAQLQHLLRQEWTGEVLRGDPNDPNRGARVRVKSELAPWDVVVEGAFMLYGEPQFYEADLDIRKIETANDFLLLVAQLNKSFEKAATQLARG